MATNKTANYGLNQWVKSDQVVMEDFNADNAAIDAALQALDTRVTDEVKTLNSTITSKTNTLNTRVTNEVKTLNNTITTLTTILTGSYTGDGSKTRTISLPFTPRLLIVQRSDQPFYILSGALSYLYGGITAPGQPRSRGGTTYLEIVDNGFRICHGESENSSTQYLHTNTKDSEYHYIAFR